MKSVRSCDAPSCRRTLLTQDSFFPDSPTLCLVFSSNSSIKEVETDVSIITTEKKMAIADLKRVSGGVRCLSKPHAPTTYVPRWSLSHSVSVLFTSCRRLWFCQQEINQDFEWYEYVDLSNVSPNQPIARVQILRISSVPSTLPRFQNHILPSSVPGRLAVLESKLLFNSVVN